jgi:hypothetical protein
LRANKPRILLLLISLGVCWSGESFCGSENQDKVIGIAKAPLRAAANFLEQPFAKFPYGTEVEIISKNGIWYKVSIQGKIGWIPQSALSDRYFVLHDIGKGESASAETYKSEIVTAGKGFSPEYESLMRIENSNLKYSEVNKIEGLECELQSLSEFSKAAGLKSNVLQ